MRKPWLLILLMLLPMLACGLPGSGETAEPAESAALTEPPLALSPAAIPAAPDQPPGESPCGDGVCDEAEQANTALCPQDCGGAAVPRAEVTLAPAADAPDYEPPINIALILHIDPLGMEGTETFSPDPGMYMRVHNEIDWLTEEAARHDLRFTALYNGWYPQMALEMGDLAQFEALLAAGHEIGSHAHRITYDAAQDVWVSRNNEVDRYGHPHYDAAVASQCWEDAYAEVDAVLQAIGAAGQNRTMCAVPFMCSDEGQLMSAFGFTIAAGNRSEKGPAYLGHMVWNPWRPSANDEPGHELEEDLSVGYIAVDHYAQIGSAETHGMDLSVPQLQRHFLMLYAEWLARERSGAEDRVWTFGFVYHPNQGEQYNADLVEFLDWLDTYFVGKQSPYGHTIVRYATVGQIANEYTAWEAAHPGASSFSYVRGDPYPYTYEIIPAMLDGAAYEAHVNLGADVTAFRFARDGRPIYMLWSDAGEQTVDLSTELSGQVLVTSAAGEQLSQEASTVALTEEPTFVEPSP
jgi:hypothetical protein